MKLFTRITIIVSSIAILLVGVCVCVFVVYLSYTPFALSVPPTKGPVPVWVQEIQTNPACPLPCWEGIIPGETLLRDVPYLVSQAPGVNRIFQPSPISPRPGSAFRTDWDMSFGPGEEYWAVAYALNEDAVVSIIRLNISSGLYTNVNMADVIGKFGQPEYIQAIHCDGTYCNFHLIYPALGLAIGITTQDQKVSGMITAQTSANTILLYPRGLDAYQQQWGKFGNYGAWYPIIEWQGYGRYTPGGEFQS